MTTRQLFLTLCAIADALEAHPDSPEAIGECLELLIAQIVEEGVHDDARLAEEDTLL